MTHHIQWKKPRRISYENDIQSKTSFSNAKHTDSFIYIDSHFMCVREGEGFILVSSHFFMRILSHYNYIVSKKNWVRIWCRIFWSVRFTWPSIACLLSGCYDYLSSFLMVNVFRLNKRMIWNKNRNKLCCVFRKQLKFTPYVVIYVVTKGKNEYRTKDISKRRTK